MYLSYVLLIMRGCIADQKIAILQKGDGILVMAEDDLSFKLRRLNASYSVDDFHASVASARQIESIIRSGKTLALSGDLEVARARLLQAQELEKDLSQGVISLLHKGSS
jgi:hypothetical protein